MAKKDVRCLNAYELIGASIRWFLDIDNLTLSDHRACLQHLDFYTVRAMHEHFKDSAHIEYDLAIRRLAETQGFAAFSSENKYKHIYINGNDIILSYKYIVASIYILNSLNELYLYI